MTSTVLELILHSVVADRVHQERDMSYLINLEGDNIMFTINSENELIMSVLGRRPQEININKVGYHSLPELTQSLVDRACSALSYQIHN